jgi:hypothetical protein
MYHLPARLRGEVLPGRIIWRDTYSIGNEEIDAEHQHLIELANDVATFAASGEKVAKIKGDIVALYDCENLFSARRRIHARAWLPAI